MAVAAYLLGTSFVASLPMFIGPLPTALMVHPAFRASLMAPPPGGRRMSSTAERNSLEGMILISALPAIVWVAAMLLALVLLFRRDVRPVGLIGLAVGAGIFLITLARYALYAMQHA